MIPRIASRAAAVAATLTLGSATAAAAHPSFDPNQVPGGEPVEATLVIPHGCGADGGMPDDDGGDPTTLFELQLTDAFAAFEPGAVDGWETTRDGDVVSWRDAGGATTEPIELPVSFTVTGRTDDELYLSAYQACEAGGELRWIGTPEREADLPAVKLTLTSPAAGGDEAGGAPTPTAPARPDTSDGREGSDGTSPEDAEAGFPARPVAIAVVLALIASAGALALRRRGAA